MIWICKFFSLLSHYITQTKPAFHKSLMLVGLLNELEQVAQILSSN